MKNVATFILISIFSLGSAFAQQDIIAQVKDAIRTGSSKEMVKLLSSSVDMTIDGKLKTYSSSQAEFILRDFFKKNPPTSFTLVHQGASKSGSPYAIGEYLSNEQKFRVWISVKKQKELFVVNQISFIKE